MKKKTIGINEPVRQTENSDWVNGELLHNLQYRITGFDCWNLISFKNWDFFNFIAVYDRLITLITVANSFFFTK